MNPEEHETYRSGVGTLLHLTKHSRPDICNPVREQSKTMDAPVPAHLKEMYKVLRHVLSTKGYGLKFELRKDIMKWALKAPSDSAFNRKCTKDTFKGSLFGCQENVSNITLTIVCTINVSIDCDCFDVPSPSERKNIHKIKSSQWDAWFVFCFLK